MKDPHNIKQLRAVLGLIGFYRKFIEGFGKTAEPFYQFQNKSGKTLFEWSLQISIEGTERKTGGSTTTELYE